MNLFEKDDAKAIDRAGHVQRFGNVRARKGKG